MMFVKQAMKLAGVDRALEAMQALIFFFFKGRCQLFIIVF